MLGDTLTINSAEEARANLVGHGFRCIVLNCPLPDETRSVLLTRLVYGGTWKENWSTGPVYWDYISNPGSRHAVETAVDRAIGDHRPVGMRDQDIKLELAREWIRRYDPGMKISPVVSRVLVAAAGVATTVAALPQLNWQIGLSLLGTFATGVAAYNIKGKVTAP